MAFNMPCYMPWIYQALASAWRNSFKRSWDTWTSAEKHLLTGGKPAFLEHGKKHETCCVKLSKYIYKYHWFLHMFPLYTGATGRQQVWNHSTHSLVMVGLALAAPRRPWKKGRRRGTRKAMAPARCFKKVVKGEICLKDIWHILTSSNSERPNISFHLSPSDIFKQGINVLIPSYKRIWNGHYKNAIDPSQKWLPYPKHVGFPENISWYLVASTHPKDTTTI